MPVRNCLALTLALATLACGPPPPPESPTDPAPEASPDPEGNPAPEATAFEVRGDLEREKLPPAMPEVPLTKRALVKAPPGVPPAPPECAAFVRRKASAAATCTSDGEARAALVDAIAIGAPDARDAALAALEACAPLPPGIARALRIELAPVACADTLAAPFLAAPAPGTGGLVYDTIYGLALTGMLSRTVQTPPEAPLPHDKANLKKWTDTTLKSWIQQQAGAIQTLSEAGAKLRYYGRAVVAVEAGMADMRFIDVARKVAIPSEFDSDAELAEAYYQGLEDALEPRKRRGRDAALVGLGNFATIGLLRDPRVTRARELLSRMYGGAPVDALDALLLPPLEPVAPKTVDEQIAARVQSFYASLLLPPERAEPLLRFVIERGLALPHRIALAKTELSPEQALLVARARLEMGQAYWRKTDIDEAVALLAPLSAAERGERGQLLMATALALRGGPANAMVMMNQAKGLGIGNVKALDKLAASEGPYRGMAAFNAAYISQLTAPGTAAATYWDAVAKRYEQASSLLVDVRYKRLADERIEEAKQTAAAIRKRSQK